MKFPHTVNTSRGPVTFRPVGEPIAGIPAGGMEAFGYAAPYQLSWPLAPAEPYAWPGGYPIGYLTDDGEHLCAACVNDPSNPVHFGGDGDGWRIDALDVLEGTAEDYDGPIACAHCGAVLVAEED